MAESELQLDASTVADNNMLQQQSKGQWYMDLASRKAEEASLRRYDAAGWLREIVGEAAGNLVPAQPSEEEFRLGLRSGMVLCNALNKVQPGAVPKVVEAPSDSVVVPDGAALRSYQYFENLRNFLDFVEGMGIPAFEASDLEQGGKSSRIVNCVLALKSYNDWKVGGGKGVWKFSGSSKPLPSAGKPQFVRKNSDLFMNSRSRNSSTVEKPSDSSIIEQNSSRDIGMDINEMDNSDSLHSFVRQLLSDKKQEDIPLIVENILSKVMEEFELRLAKENEQAGLTSRDLDVPTSNEHESIKDVPSSDEHVEDETTLREMDVTSPSEHVEIEDETTSRDTDIPRSNVEIEANTVEVKTLSEDELRDRKLKQLALKRQRLVEHHQRSVQELKSTLDCTKQDLHMLIMKYQEEVQNLGKHLNVLANAASRYQNVLVENRKLYNQVQDLKGNIRIYCRIRPSLSGQPTDVSAAEAVDEQTLSILRPAKNGKAKKLFTFNRVFGPSASQDMVFSDTQPLIRSVLDGYNVCIFAYGETGSGKTYTMTGPEEFTTESLGVNYRALSDLFCISEQRKDSISYDVSIQMMEIYNEQVRDLLTNNEICNNSGNGVNVPDANLVPVRSTSDAFNLMNLGHKNQASMNDRSSRSHSCVAVHVQGRNLTSGSIIRGCMHLVDLAGSERVDEDADGDRLNEGQHISRSLSTLADVISSLALKQKNIPYRNSKLTQLLQDSLGGQAKTLMFVHISPEAEALGETISTLKFAERVSNGELGAGRTNNSNDARELKEQIASLKAALLRKKRGEQQGQSRTISPDRLTAASFASSPAPSWKSSGDLSRAEGQSECSSISRMQSLDPQDFVNSPPWAALGSAGGSLDDEKGGDWVDKDVMVKSSTSKVYPEQQLNKNIRKSLDNSFSRPQHDTIESDDLEPEISDSSEKDYKLKINVSKSPNGVGPKARRPTLKQTKGSETRSQIPPSPTRKGANGSHSPLQKSGKKAASAADAKRKPAPGRA